MEATYSCHGMHHMIFSCFLWVYLSVSCPRVVATWEAASCSLVSQPLGKHLVPQNLMNRYGINERARERMSCESGLGKRCLHTPVRN